MQKLFEYVFSATNTVALYNELARLLTLRPVRSFTRDERDLMTPPGATVTDSSTFDITLMNKIISECRQVNFSSGGRSFSIPTGLRLSRGNIPNLAGANSGDYATLIKDMRNTIMHWPDQEMNQNEFDNLWAFFADLLARIGVSCSDLGDLRSGAYIMSDKFVTSNLQIMKEYRKEIGKRRSFYP